MRSVPSAFKARSHQYQPSDPTRPMAVSASLALIAARTAACRFS
jgi:hypothetical protein